MRHVSVPDDFFDDVYRELWATIYKFIYYKVQNNEEAEELTQEVFRKVYLQVKEKKVDEDKIKAYTFTTARNTVYDTWRRRGDTKIIHLDDLNEAALKSECKNQSIEDGLVVRAALNKLSEQDKRVLTLRIIKGYSVKEVSKILDKPEGTIKSLQFRALKKLREILAKGGFFGEQ